ncbi:hypothetical protein I6B53_08525 [Schaalia sp. 19OD2882]|uniref:hypothetical protein n=1 Tax=Schaalia sp. 19OD2882 TaxID=2794089 RepID=UPI001C1EE302|nr:hypothetical protein [Schaalia sp. 19OD2882]QWW19145.1 hypothetical protein I6B53_08525 [Schaalia sp. 19OD2882]
MLGYRSSFTVDLNDSLEINAASAVDVLLREGFTWLRKKGLREIDDLVPLSEHALPNGDKVIHTIGRTAAGAHYGRLIYFDRPQPAGQFVTSLLVGLDPNGRTLAPKVVVDIDVPPDPRREGQPCWANRPKLIQQFLETYTCLDGRMQLRDQPQWLSHGDGVEALVDHLQDPHRRGLVIVCAEDGTVAKSDWTRILQDITAETSGQALVVVLDQESTSHFNDLVSSAHHIKAYCPRTFKRSVDVDDPRDALRHRTLSAKRMLESQPRFLRRMYGRICREQVNMVGLEKFTRRLDFITGREMDMANKQPSAVVVVPETAEPALQAGKLSLLIPTIEAVPSDTLIAPSASADARHENLAQSVMPASSSATAEDPARVDALARAESAEKQVMELERHVRALEASEVSLRAALDQANSAIRNLEEQRELTALEHDEVLQEVSADHAAKIEDLQLEMRHLEEEKRMEGKARRQAEYRLEQARRLLHESGVDVGHTRELPEDPYDQEVSEWDELQVFGPECFQNLILPVDWGPALDLADHDPAGQWLAYTWDALVFLDEYCAYRLSAEGRDFRGGIREYLSGGAPAGKHLISADRYRPNESNSVKVRKKMSDERCFRVSPEVDASGQLFMCKHLVIQTRGSISPRLYFEDRTADLGKIVVGYIGRHLKNTKTC